MEVEEEDHVTKTSKFVVMDIKWVVGAVGLVLFLTFVRLNRELERPRPLNKSPGDLLHSSLCFSPNCIRCRGPGLASISQRLLHKLVAFFHNVPLTEASVEVKRRMFSLITDSVKFKGSILSAVYEESGYGYLLDEEADLDNLPHIWVLPRLTRRTFWNPEMHEALRETVSLLEDPTNFKGIQEDFRLISQKKIGWKINKTPSGRWKIYKLCDQGKIVTKNSKRCAFTQELLRSLPLRMKKHVFGNAMFSVLKPGSCIEPHTGPCNYRLRCHLPLVVPPGYKLQVGKDILEWKEGQVVIFDDSFVHEVWHEKGDEPHSSLGRAVLIFDIWHPDLTSEEQSAIECIMSELSH